MKMKLDFIPNHELCWNPMSILLGFIFGMWLFKSKLDLVMDLC
jgi:hypothetical protein